MASWCAWFCRESPYQGCCDAGDAVPSTGEPEPVGRGRRYADRRSEDRRQHRFCFGSTLGEAWTVSDDLHRNIPNTESCGFDLATCRSQKDVAVRVLERWVA